MEGTSSGPPWGNGAHKTCDSGLADRRPREEQAKLCFTADFSQDEEISVPKSVKKKNITISDTSLLTDVLALQ